MSRLKKWLKPKRIPEQGNLQIMPVSSSVADITCPALAAHGSGRNPQRTR